MAGELDAIASVHAWAKSLYSYGFEWLGFGVGSSLSLFDSLSLLTVSFFLCRTELRRGKCISFSLLLLMSLAAFIFLLGPVVFLFSASWATAVDGRDESHNTRALTSITWARCFRSNGRPEHCVSLGGSCWPLTMGRVSFLLIFFFMGGRVMGTADSWCAPEWLYSKREPSVLYMRSAVDGYI